MASQDLDSVAPQPSATVALVREAESHPEVLMVERRPGDTFGEAYAFPGGILDAGEAEASLFCAGVGSAEANKVLNLESGGLDFYSAAVRELFEETGVLLARDSAGRWALETDAHLESLREQLDTGELSWADLLQQHELTIACDTLHYFAFWETPLKLKRRFAARFFLAELPFGHYARHDGRELTNSRWMAAAAVLDAEREGGITLPFPTRMSLRRMEPFASVESLIAWAREQASVGVSKIRPVILEEGGERRFVIPGDADYPEDSEA